MFSDPGMEGRLGRKRKTPAEMAAEANAEDEEEGSNAIFLLYFIYLLPWWSS